MIHTFGDSHAYYAWNQIYPIQTNIKFGSLCYSFGRDGLKRFNIKSKTTLKIYTELQPIELQPIQDNDIIIFSFGEVDCRNHIYKHIDENNSYESIIDNIITNYFIRIEENIQQFNNLRVYIYNIIPPVKITNLKTPDYNGPDEDRKKYVLYFNECLKKHCILKNWGFIDIYDQLVDNEGYLIRSISENHVHLIDCSYLLNFLKNILTKDEFNILQPKQTFIAIGDSHSLDNHTDCWVRLLKLSNTVSNNYDFIWTIARPGNTTIDGINVKIYDDILHNINKTTSPLVTILYGTNDSHKKIPLNEYKQNLYTIISNIIKDFEEYGIKCTIVIITPPPIIISHPNILHKNKEIMYAVKTIKLYVCVCIEVANELNYLYFDLYNILKDSRHFIDSDGIHLSEDGHYKFYDEFCKFLKNI